jgi:glycosyltransferase involved in cell wall biosynthesis
MEHATRLISVVLPCYNEAGNVRELYAELKGIFAGLEQYRYEFLFIDNASTDRTVEILKELAAGDPDVKIIVNARNFGHIRSPHHAFLVAGGDAAIVMATDFQDPPGLIPAFIAKWEQGFKTVMAVKVATDETPIVATLRRCYYRLLNRISEVRLVDDATGFGLYDRCVMDVIRSMNDAYPYFRGMVSEIGYEVATIPFHKPARRGGLSKNRIYNLYDMAMLGMINHSRVPLRLATMSGFVMAAGALVVAFGYLIAKLLFWNFFPAGAVPMLISLFFFSSVQLFFIGILGEYIGAIYTQVLNRPLVVEKERINLPATAASNVHGTISREAA